MFALLYTKYLGLIDGNLRETIEEMKSTQETLHEQIEENKIIQEELIKEKMLLDAIMNNLPDYIFFKDKQ